MLDEPHDAPNFSDVSPLGQLSPQERQAMQTRRNRRQRFDRYFVLFCILAASSSLLILATLLSAILYQASHRNEAIIDVVKSPVPVNFTDWANVDMDALSGYLREDFSPLEELAAVDWQQLGESQGLTTAEDIARVDWAKLKKDQKLRKLRRKKLKALEEMDWPVVMASLGQSGSDAWWNGYAPDRFLQEVPSRKAEKAGIYPALWGTILTCLVCAFTAVPIGIGTAVLLEEFKPKAPFLAKLQGFIQLNITNLAGVPSIVYGILGLTAFANMFGKLGTVQNPLWELGSPENWYYLRLPFDRGVATGGLTLMLVVLPVIIIASQEALRAVPNSLRQGALALGATRWQMVRRMTMPSAIPGIMTGTILAMSRAIGEAAPMLVIAGIVYITFTPEHLMDDFTVLPLQIYNWAGRPQQEFHDVAAAGIVVLLALLLSFNAVAVFIRYKFQRPLS